MENKSFSLVGMSFTQCLTVAFVVLKLTGVVAWSWWWVLSPLWIPVALAVLAVLCVVLLASV